MTAHCRNQERPAALCFHRVDDAGEQFDETTHAATAGNDRDLRIGLQRIEARGLEQSLSRFIADIRDVLAREKLRHVSEWR